MEDLSSSEEDQNSDKDLSQSNRILKAKLKKESLLVREDSMAVLKEFENQNDAPPL